MVQFLPALLGERGEPASVPGGFGEWFGSAVWLWRGCAPGRLRAAIDLGRSPLLADLAWRLVSGLRERGRFTPAFPLTWGGSFLDSGGRLSAGPTRTEGCSGKAPMRQCGADSGRSGFTYLGYLPTHEGKVLPLGVLPLLLLALTEDGRGHLSCRGRAPPRAHG